MNRIEVAILHYKKVLHAKSGDSILQVLRDAGIDVESSCAGEGICGKCKVQILGGEVSPIEKTEAKLLSEAELSRGIRLACRTKLIGNTRLSLLSARNRGVKILEQGDMPEFAPCPNIRKVFVALNRPSLEDNRSDLERIEEELRFAGKVPLSIVQSLPPALRNSEFKITCVLSADELIGVEEGDTSNEGYGVALDIGTTNVVASVIDINTGREVGSASGLNTQVKYGADVLSRIQQTRRNPERVEELKGLIVGTVNSLIRQICAEHGIDRKNIYELVAAGNPTMIHLFLGVSPACIGVSPYAPAFRRGLTVKASEIGIDISEFGEVYCLPIASGYIGADVVAGIMATELRKAKEPTLMIDLGTNGEISFCSVDTMVACSCAAGPAFEGASISRGMMATEGAIEAVNIGDSVKVKTIGDKPPTGVCGSGILDVAAEMFKCGAMNKLGRILSQEEFLQRRGSPVIASRLGGEDGQRRFILVEDPYSGDDVMVHISQDDIRQVQLAKGAVSSAITVLAKEVGVEFGNISQVFLAGAFGKNVRPESLATIGLIPQELANSITIVGNSSKAGAVMALLSGEKREEAEDIARSLKYIELSDYPEYERLFASCLDFSENEGNKNDVCRHRHRFPNDRTGFVEGQ
ncbi:MAG: ASKHA domain-containing protein [Thermodesulfobacteriota bacterium]|nr:ASKHA domain-containing protein [Thermodesulfobacteriota bacterium]